MIIFHRIHRRNPCVPWYDNDGDELYDGPKVSPAKNFPWRQNQRNMYNLIVREKWIRKYCNATQIMSRLRLKVFIDRFRALESILMGN